MHIIELQHCGRLLRLDKGACCVVEGEVGAKRSGRCVHSWSASPLCPTRCGDRCVILCAGTISLWDQPDLHRRSMPVPARNRDRGSITASAIAFCMTFFWRNTGSAEVHA
jgi:hypothetical protein